MGIRLLVVVSCIALAGVAPAAHRVPQQNAPFRFHHRGGAGRRARHPRQHARGWPSRRGLRGPRQRPAPESRPRFAGVDAGGSADGARRERQPHGRATGATEGRRQSGGGLPASDGSSAPAHLLQRHQAWHGLDGRSRTTQSRHRCACGDGMDVALRCDVCRVERAGRTGPASPPARVYRRHRHVELADGHRSPLDRRADAADGVRRVRDGRGSRHRPS